MTATVPDVPEADPAQAKEPVTRLAGPYGHPFHPMLVTVPIGAWVASFAFDLASRSAGEAEVFVKASFWLIVVGIIGAVVAALFGLLDLLTIRRGTRAFRTGVTHMILNTVALGLFGVSLLLRRDHLDDGDVTVGGFVVSSAALVILGASGWLGGMLTYHYGVRVARESTQRDGFTR
jgi:uncharacterized membrane protein